MIRSMSCLAAAAGLFVLMGPVNCSSADDVARRNGPDTMVRPTLSINSHGAVSLHCFSSIGTLKTQTAARPLEDQHGARRRAGRDGLLLVDTQAAGQVGRAASSCWGCGGRSQLARVTRFGDGHRSFDGVRFPVVAQFERRSPECGGGVGDADRASRGKPLARHAHADAQTHRRVRAPGRVQGCDERT